MSITAANSVCRAHAWRPLRQRALPTREPAARPPPALRQRLPADDRTAAASAASASKSEATLFLRNVQALTPRGSASTCATPRLRAEQAASARTCGQFWQCPRLRAPGRIYFNARQQTRQLFCERLHQAKREHLQRKHATNHERGAEDPSRPYEHILFCSLATKPLSWPLHRATPSPCPPAKSRAMAQLTRTPCTCEQIWAWETWKCHATIRAMPRAFLSCAEHAGRILKATATSASSPSTTRTPSKKTHPM